MARAALDALPIDKVIFLPTGATKYRAPARASMQDRLAMLQLALAGEPRYLVDERELEPQATGYTVDTLKGMRAQNGEEIYFLMGADQLAKLDTWHRPD